jgi:phage tail sheath gpL-like
MATRETTIKIRHRDDQVPSAIRFRNARDYAIHELCDHFMGMLSGSRMGDIEITDDSTANGTEASGSITFSGVAAGTVTVTINGVAIPVVVDADDIEAPGLVAGEINNWGNPLVDGLVTATAIANVLHINAKQQGTLASCPRLTGGTDNTEIFTLSR